MTSTTTRFQAMVQIAFGSANRAAATLSVMNNTLPVATIDTPVLVSNYIGGSVISFSGSGADHEDRILPESEMSWRINLSMILLTTTWECRKRLDLFLVRSPSGTVARRHRTPGIVST